MPPKMPSTDPSPEVTVLIRKTPSKLMTKREREAATQDMACDIWQRGGMLVRRIGSDVPLQLQNDIWDRVNSIMTMLLCKHNPLSDVHEVREGSDTFIVRRVVDNRIPPSTKR